MCAKSEGSDETARMRRLARVFAVYTGHFVVFYWFCHAAAQIYTNTTGKPGGHLFRSGKPEQTEHQLEEKQNVDEQSHS